MTGADLARMLPDMLPRLWSFALRLSGNAHDAEDLVQLACAKAIEHADQMEQNSAPLNWMFSILRSMWITDVCARSVHYCERIDLVDDFSITVPDPDTTDSQEPTQNAQVIRAVQQLPEEQRTVMLLVVIEGLSYQEAADILAVPISTVMRRMLLARQTIGVKFMTRDNHAKDAENSGGREVSRNGAVCPLCEEHYPGQRSR
ncbi:RNA polymerase sigma factor [Paraburkholderia sp. LEh10]|uniref:RNA polymerase sigma factor n=1 Tax=Paraburkholderia sp. LEh10 TaxID=2821353 RepID=UPI001AE7B5C7|nr:RNA polymerase sigma factor [Paraburkholderia sp. LEh10]MBP0594781.1 RNA polymerase sigma factor [Paraburkholderia sp. LEh10]